MWVAYDRCMAPLSLIETSILKHIALGFHSKEIAGMLRRSKPTVEGYVRTLYIKLGARSRAHLITRAFSCGILRLEDVGNEPVHYQSSTHS